MTRRLALDPFTARFSQNGVEFLSYQPFPLWAELVLAVRDPATRDPIQCPGVVVRCDSTGGFGYLISVLFLAICPRVRERFSQVNHRPHPAAPWN